MQSTDSEACLVVMFKAPDRSKRRLATQIGGLAAAAADRLFACAREDAAEWPGAVCFAPAQQEDADWLATRVGAQPLVILQRGATLGERLNHVNLALWERSLTRQVFIGIDCPQLDAKYLQAAAERLASHDLVVGPALDGGAVLIASRKRLPDIADLPWSTPDLLRALIERAAGRQWTASLLPPLTDVDTVDDLRAAAAALRLDGRAARRAFCDWLAQAQTELVTQV